MTHNCDSCQVRCILQGFAEMLMNFMNTCIKNRKSRGGLFFLVCLFVFVFQSCLSISWGVGEAGFPPQIIEKI